MSSTQPTGSDGARPRPAGGRRPYARTVALMTLWRVAAITAVEAAAYYAIPPEADPIGIGLTFFVLLAATAGSWALVDAFRHRAADAATTWLAVSALCTLTLPLVNGLQGAAPARLTGLSDYLSAVADWVPVGLAVMLVPATAGIGLVTLVRLTGQQAA